MTWKLNVGSRQLEFSDEMAGLGLMATPQVKPLIEIDSYANPRGDGRRNGRMYRRGQAVSLSIEARPDERPVDEVWREFLSVWRADEIRSQPGAMARLTAETGRFTVGLPADIEPDQEYRIFDTNRASVVFEAQDDLWYGPEELSRIKFVPPSSGGLQFPAVAPFTFDSGPTVRNSSVQISGDVETWPVFEIYGPVANPAVEIVGVGTLVFDVSLAYDQFLRVDTRPWARWVQRGYVQNSSVLAPLPGALSPAGSRLSDMALRPGTYSILLRGYDTTGTAELGVIRNPAYTSF